LKIIDVKTFSIKGVLPFDEEVYWEERLVRPADIYSEYKDEGPNEVYRTSVAKSNSARELKTTSYFIEIATDGGITGLAPTTAQSSWIIRNQFRSYLVGKDPLETEKNLGSTIPYQRSRQEGLNDDFPQPHRLCTLGYRW
jgi:hypothetical protein